MWIRFVNHFQEEIGIYCPPSFHHKEQNSQPFFSEKIIAFLPSAPHSFGRQGADKIGNSSDPTSQIDSPESTEMSILRKNKKKKHCSWKEFGKWKVSAHGQFVLKCTIPGFFAL